MKSAATSPRESAGCTQSDLAQILGVSQMTVHRALNGHPAVKPALRDRVLEAAAEHGYRPSSSARAMRSGRFGCIALMASSRPFHSYAPQNLLDGVQDQLNALDLHLMMARMSDAQLTDENFVPKILREWMADGLLVDYIQSIPERLVDIIHRHKIPAIWLNSKQPADCVRPDDWQAGFRATRELLERGHRRIAFVNFSHSSRTEVEHYSGAERCAGYEAALAEAGLLPQVIRGAEKALPQSQWLDTCIRVFSAPDRPTGVILYGREHTTIAIAALKCGLEIPRDLSVIAFGRQGAEIAGTPLSIMVIPEYEMGSVAVQMLMEKMSAPQRELPTRTLDFQFLPGDTLAPAPPLS